MNECVCVCTYVIKYNFEIKLKKNTAKQTTSTPPQLNAKQSSKTENCTNETHKQHTSQREDDDNEYCGLQVFGGIYCSAHSVVVFFFRTLLIFLFCLTLQIAKQ